VSRRRPRSRRRRLPPSRPLPPLTPTARQPRASPPRRWNRPSARLMVRPPLSLLRRRAPQCSHLRGAGQVRCGGLPPRMDSPAPANRQQTSCRPPAEPAHRPPLARFLRCRRLARVMSVGRRLARVRGLVRPADYPAVRDRLGVAPGFHARVTTRSRLLRAWASPAHLGPALQIRPGLADPVHRWAMPPCREAGQACPACRGRIPP
jgi:hypothetical protein